ncbi:unnamed protein product [Owenia fusiformis]|uniref:Endoplasmic reticulum lectin 1 n=1 Tax=Owenia fusiformis TaxID=6347 RepID=A0A8J1XWN0_OWEFU|nr:unnamed protein product [Owenia fusiformis]
MVHDIEYSFLLLYGIFLTAQANYDPFMDNVVFKLDWPGSTLDDVSPSLEDADGNSVVVTTADQEKYKCILPDTMDDSNDNNQDAYSGPTELELLAPLFKQSACSYRIESYWTYELCHGKHLRQYNEEKLPGKDNIKIQEYFLGRYVPPKQTEGGEEETTTEKRHAKPPIMKLEGNDYAYFDVKMSGGTPCDLTQEPRRTTLHYVCHTEGKGEIYELKESSTCNYDVIVLSKQLCKHPDYKPKIQPVNAIKCHPLGNSPVRPSAMEDPITQFLRNDGSTGPQGTIKISVNGEEIETGYEIQIEPPVEDKDTYHKVESKPLIQDTQLIKDFMAGDYCLVGGAGWWKHEFCYGKSASQFHEERGQTKTVILLGKWNEYEHLKWLKNNPNKRPKEKSSRKYISQFYSDGSICDLTGKPRHVEVKLKCLNNPTNPNAVTIYLVEPKTCEYMLVVESPILCSIIEQANDDGMLPTDYNKVQP